MKVKVLSIAILCVIATSANAEETKLPSMIVGADFRPNIALKTPVSLTSINSETIESRGAQHVEDVLNLAPNVNVSSGASRGQYFQIRGIGERSEFKAPLNPSVGLYIDGIDLSRSGGAATLFDIEQVEILRGPQGTLYGANALAGLINLQSKQPTEELAIHVETGIANHNTHNVGVAVGGALIENVLLGRMSVYSYQSDGYMDNSFLGRNTQDKDEITARGHLKWLVNNDLTLDLNLLHIDIDNGYDAFTFDNTRNSVADQPGKDAQKTDAFALKSDWRANDKIQIQSTVTYSQSDLEYSYDDDWSNANQFDPDDFPYSGFDQYLRDRENYSFEGRILSNENGKIFNNSTAWTVGFYHANQKQDLNRNYFDNDTPDVFPFSNAYDTLNTSIFGQLNSDLSEKLMLISGLRIENWQAEYSDSNSLDIEKDEVLYGGKLGLQYQIEPTHMLFTTLSRGYKAGGINDDPRLTSNERSFDSEYSWTIEAGIKSAWLEGDLITNITTFYTLRKDAQLKTSLAVPKVLGPGTDFIDYFVNAEKVTNIGVEADLDWFINNQWRVLASVGLLDAVLDDYENPELLADGITLSGRRIAHAPAYQFSLGGEYYVTNNWTFRANVEGKDEFYFSNSHNSKSNSYVLVNSSLDYAKGNWKVSVWGRNLLDKDYDTRGFFFGIDPSADYAPKSYTQKGDPRVVGVNLTWDY
ncbi:MAG: TonB-dependent receptor [Gammaproteobacteria bacterium]|nr:TonB-dependent receptor [Gammaproteobacteria bacterium]